jgi:hypothetical protein
MLSPRAGEPRRPGLEAEIRQSVKGQASADSYAAGLSASNATPSLRRRQTREPEGVGISPQ